MLLRRRLEAMEPATRIITSQLIIQMANQKEYCMKLGVRDKTQVVDTDNNLHHKKGGNHYGMVNT